MNPLVCVPTRSAVHAMTMASVFRTCAGFPGPIGFQTFLAQPVDHARNLCVRHLLSGEWTHLLFVDSDIELPDDALLRLLAADVPIASGLYPLQLANEGLCLSAAVATGPQEVRFITERPAAAAEADVTGLGCCLIRRDVLEALDAPWFRFELREDGQLIGEDVEFFLRVRAQLGIRPVVVPEVLCSHHREVDLGALWRRAEQARAEAAAAAEAPPADATPPGAEATETPGDSLPPTTPPPPSPPTPATTAEPAPAAIPGLAPRPPLRVAAEPAATPTSAARRDEATPDEAGTDDAATVLAAVDALIEPRDGAGGA